MWFVQDADGRLLVDTDSTSYKVTTNTGVLGGVHRQSGTMTTTNSPVSANLLNNCVGSAPAVPNCTA